MSTALLVIDVQRALTDAMERSRRDSYLHTLRDLIERARAGGTPVVYVRHHDPEGEFLYGAPTWEIAAEIAPREGEPIVDKTYRDSFRETDLADVLKRYDVDSLVICGMQSEFCVDATVREAERRGYAVTLVEDGHATLPDAGFSEEQIRAQVQRVAAGIVKIIPAHLLFAPRPVKV